MAHTFYAHSIEGKLPSSWELLSTHLNDVNKLSEQFAKAFGAAEWGYFAGKWHDLGKYSGDFQAYLFQENGLESPFPGPVGSVDHSTVGAWHAMKSVPAVARLLAYVIAGHHAGLSDSIKLDERLDVNSNARLRKTLDAINNAPDELLEGSQLTLSALSVNSNRKNASFQLAFFTRMVFSCLVDADFLATERFLNVCQAAERQRNLPELSDMLTVLDKYLEELISQSSDSEVNKCRQTVLSACRESAMLLPGLFSLSVPTGGGKSLSSLAFALSHATKNKLRRVIYAIPFTSIIEQTATNFRMALGSLDGDAVLEHHSNTDPNEGTRRNRLATENWDAPLVVTTNVQLFESLFANRTSRCRKLHNLVGSVIVLDEVQTLPVELLKPCLAALQELVTNYRCSVVLCTATQPAITKNSEFSIGLEEVREIIPDPQQLSIRMKRVKIYDIGQLADDELVDRLEPLDVFLCIVNTRPHAAKIFSELRRKSVGQDSLFHLSTLLCGEHRARLIKQICSRLQHGLPCRVVSTQLIEAGVDVDFPVVFRAMTGIDSIAQAAGRCNREGRQRQGSVYLFDPLQSQPIGYLGSVAASAREVLPDVDDPLDAEALKQYFKLHYWKQKGEHQWDDKQVMDCFPENVERLEFNFLTAAERFRMIENHAETIFVPIDEKATRLVEQLRNNGPTRGLLRSLQRYTVSVYEPIYRKLLAAGDIELTTDGHAFLTNHSLYDEQLGLRIDRPGWREPESMIV